MNPKLALCTFSMPSRGRDMRLVAHSVGEWVASAPGVHSVRVRCVSVSLVRLLCPFIAHSSVLFSNRR